MIKGLEYDSKDHCQALRKTSKMLTIKYKYPRVLCSDMTFFGTIVGSK